MNGSTAAKAAPPKAPPPKAPKPPKGKPAVDPAALLEQYIGHIDAGDITQLPGRKVRELKRILQRVILRTKRA